MRFDFNKFELLFYKAPNGRLPVREWLNTLDEVTRSKVVLKMNALSAGHFGNCKYLMNSVWELKINLGPGYRIYFGRVHNKVILLLNAGDKKTQQRDIKKSVQCLEDFLESI